MTSAEVLAADQDLVQFVREHIADVLQLANPESHGLQQLQAWVDQPNRGRLGHQDVWLNEDDERFLTNATPATNARRLQLELATVDACAAALMYRTVPGMEGAVTLATTTLLNLARQYKNHPGWKQAWE